MIKIIGWLLIFTVVFAFFYGFLIVKEYIRYFIRLLRLRLDARLKEKKK